MEALNGIQGAPAPVGPYSQAVKSGNTLYLSGQIGIVPESGALASGVEEQLRQVLKNIDAVLEGAGSSRSKILLSTIFLADIADGKMLNEVYGEWVSGEAPPARQTVAVKDLPMGALVEISIIAEA